MVALDGDAVWVETVRSSLCGSCAAKAGCGHGVLARASSARGLIRARETERVAARECAVNDEVDIELPESAVLKGSLLVYLLPLLLAMSAAVLSNPLGEPATIAAFGAALALGFLLVRILPPVLGAREQFEPRLAGLRKVRTDLITKG